MKIIKYDKNNKIKYDTYNRIYSQILLVCDCQCEVQELVPWD